MEQPNLQPLTVTEILDKAFRLYRAKFFPLVGIVALMLIPQGIFKLIATYYLKDTLTAYILLSLIFQNLAMLALIVALSNVNLGKEFTIISAYLDGMKWFWSLLWCKLIIVLAIVFPAIIFLLCMALVVPLGLFRFVLLMPLLVFVATRSSLSTSAIVLEKTGAFDGWRRSWELTEGFFWKVLGTSFSAGLLSILLTLLPYYLAGTTLKMMDFPSKTIELITTAVQQISLIFSMPFTSAVQVLIYYDLCIRKEGFDLMLRANEMR